MRADPWLRASRHFTSCTRRASRSTTRSRMHARVMPDDVVLAAAGIHVELGGDRPAAGARAGRRACGARRRPARGRDPRRAGAARAGRARRRGARGAAGRAGQGSCRPRTPLVELQRSAATASSSRSAGARRRTWPASRRRPTCAAFRGSRCRRRSSVRWMPRSAARPPSTCPVRRTSPAPSTGLRGWSPTRPLLETLAEEERRNGLAEVVKTGLLAGEPLWELPEHEQVRRCAAFKGAVCLARPRRSRAAQPAQPGSHLRPRARGGGRVRAAAR